MANYYIFWKRGRTSPLDGLRHHFSPALSPLSFENNDFPHTHKFNKHFPEVQYIYVRSTLKLNAVTVEPTTGQFAADTIIRYAIRLKPIYQSTPLPTPPSRTATYVTTIYTATYVTTIYTATYVTTI